MTWAQRTFFFCQINSCWRIKHTNFPLHISWMKCYAIIVTVFAKKNPVYLHNFGVRHGNQLRFRIEFVTKISIRLKVHYGILKENIRLNLSTCHSLDVFTCSFVNSPFDWFVHIKPSEIRSTNTYSQIRSFHAHLSFRFLWRSVDPTNRLLEFARSDAFWPIWPAVAFDSLNYLFLYLVWLYWNLHRHPHPPKHASQSFPDNQ